MNNWTKKDSYYRNRMRSNYLYGNIGRKGLMRTMMKQLLISIIIVVLIILIKSINTPVAQEISSTIKSAIIKEFNYKKGIENVVEFASRIKSETRDFTKNIPVFKSQSSNSFELPLEGVIVSTYGEKYDPMNEKMYFQRGLDIQMYEEASVKSIEDGVVETIGRSDTLGRFIKIRHNPRMFTLYCNLVYISVRENEQVRKGQRIGEIEKDNNGYLHFELWIDNEAVDPQDYLEYEQINI